MHPGPRVHPSAFLHPSAILVGEVEIGPEASVWPTAVLRGDVAPIRVGARSNVQDGCILHADGGGRCLLGEGVTVGHRAVVHGAEIGPDSLVGMGAVVLEGARIGAGSIVAAGAVVREGFDAPAGALLAGVPARVVRIDPALAQRARGNAERYVALARRYRAGEFSSSGLRPGE